MPAYFTHLAILLCALFVPASSVLAVEPAQEGITWSDDPNMAVSQARDLDLPILIYATSEHCRFCRKMERETWANRGVINQVEQDFIPLRIDSKRDAGLISRLRVRAFPTTVLITPEGQVLNGAEGFLNPRELSGLLRSLPEEEVVAKTAQLPK